MKGRQERHNAFYFVSTPLLQKLLFRQNTIDKSLVFLCGVFRNYLDGNILLCGFMNRIDDFSEGSFCNRGPYQIVRRCWRRHVRQDEAWVVAVEWNSQVLYNQSCLVHFWTLQLLSRRGPLSLRVDDFWVTVDIRLLQTDDGATAMLNVTHWQYPKRKDTFYSNESKIHSRFQCRHWTCWSLAAQIFCNCASL